MEILYERCAGLDVHKDSIVACVRIANGRRAERITRTFSTVTRELILLADWLSEHAVTHAVMESTGVYWKPAWHVLCDSVELILANATDVKAVPGRKTDVKDAEWLADLLAHGLVRASFVPPPEIQELRALTRTRKQLVRERTSHVQRIQKVLQDANIKVDSVISNIMGVSGRAFLAAIIKGETDPARLAIHGTPRLKASKDQLQDALRGFPTTHHRFMLKMHLDLIANLEAAIKSIEQEVDSLLRPFHSRIANLMTMPGVSRTMAEVIIAETGGDMTRFPSDDSLVSWAGLCPRNDESAGKRRSNRLRPGAAWLREALVQSAWAAARKKGSRFQSLFARVKARQDGKTAVVAVAAEMLRCAWHIMAKNEAFVDLDPAKADPKQAERQIQRLLKKLRALGYRDLPPEKVGAA